MLKLSRIMPRGIQAIRRAGPIPSMDIGVGVKTLSEFINTTTDGSEAYVTRLLDPQGYITQKKGKESPVVKVLASKHVVLEQLIAITPDGCGQCKWEDLRLIFGSINKLHSSQVTIVGFDVELNRYLASNYHSMLQDIKFLAKRPAAIVGLAAQSHLDEQHRNALVQVVNTVIRSTDLKADMDAFDSNILCGDVFMSELSHCTPPKKEKPQDSVAPPEVLIDPNATWVPQVPASWVNRPGGASSAKAEDKGAESDNKGVDALYAEALGCRPTPPVDKKKKILKEFKSSKADKSESKWKPLQEKTSDWKGIAREKGDWGLGQVHHGEQDRPLQEPGARVHHWVLCW